MQKEEDRDGKRKGRKGRKGRGKGRDMNGRQGEAREHEKRWEGETDDV